METPREHTEAVQSALAELAEYRSRLPHAGDEFVKAAGKQLFEVDFFVVGAIKRAVSLAAGFDSLVRNWNLICARALLRMQIDTTVRFAALNLVSDPNDFAREILSGEQLNRMQDRYGNRMTDRHLVDHLTSLAPWLTDVYEKTSDYVHFSAAQIFAPIQHLEDESRTAWFMVNEYDYKFPESSWLEVIKCFHELTALFHGQVKAWTQIKSSWASSESE